MHITLETDYAVRITNCLANTAQRTEAKRIAELTGVTLRFALKILRKLVAAGIVESFKGTKGGYVLAKEPGNITVHDVLCAVEGPYEIARCVDTSFECNRNTEFVTYCRFNRAFQAISKEVQGKLESITFQQPPPESASADEE